MSKYAMRRGINNAYSSSLFSKYVERMEKEGDVPRGTKHEVISPSNNVGRENVGNSGK